MYITTATEPSSYCSCRSLSLLLDLTSGFWCCETHLEGSIGLVKERKQQEQEQEQQRQSTSNKRTTIHNEQLRVASLSKLS